MIDANDNDEKQVREILASIGNLELPGEEEVEFCEHARNFLDWGEQLLNAKKEHTIVSINQAKILLIDKFFEWYHYVPRSHRTKHSKRGHICIFQVLEMLYNRLKIIELGITGPLIFIPPEPPPMKILPRPTIAGIVLGEDTDDNIQ